MKKTSILLVIFLTIYIIDCKPSISEPASIWTAENITYGPEERQTINIIFPKDNRDVYVIIYLHGGFYFAGNKLWFPLFLTEFAEKNIFATIGYRLISTNINNITHHNITIDHMLSDVHTALITLREYARDNGYNIKGFILVGHSAGGNLCLLYSYRYLQENDSEGIEIIAVVNLAGPTDFSDIDGWVSMSYYGNTELNRLYQLSLLGTQLTGHPIRIYQSWAHQRNIDDYLPFLEKMSPVMHVNERANIPPTLIVHGIEDNAVPYSNAVRLSVTLEKYSIPHRFISTTGSARNHMLGGSPNRLDSVEPITYADATWIGETIEWIRQFLE